MLGDGRCACRNKVAAHAENRSGGQFCPFEGQSRLTSVRTVPARSARATQREPCPWRAHDPLGHGAVGVTLAAGQEGDLRLLGRMAFELRAFDALFAGPARWPGRPGQVISKTTPRTTLRSARWLTWPAASRCWPPPCARASCRGPSAPRCATVRAWGSESASCVIQAGKRAASRSRRCGGRLRQKFILSQPPISTAPSCGCMNGFQSTCAWPPHCSSLHLAA